MPLAECVTFVCSSHWGKEKRNTHLLTFSTTAVHSLKKEKQWMGNGEPVNIKWVINRI